MSVRERERLTKRKPRRNDAQDGAENRVPGYPGGGDIGQSTRNSLNSLNPAHLKGLLGQEVMLTLSNATTRRGVVYSLDPESLTVVLVHPEAAMAGVGEPRADECTVVPGHAVQAVEVIGGNAAALDALHANGSQQSWLNGGRGAEGSAMRSAMRSINGMRTNSWGAQSKYAGVAALLKPSAEEQLEEVRRCLKENMVPFVEQEVKEGPGQVELLVLGTLVVRYPYTAESCSCTNEIVLSRIRELISRGVTNKGGRA